MQRTEDWNTYDFRYLRPSDRVWSLVHDSEYIHPTKGKKIYRTIFYTVEFSSKEKELIAEWKKAVTAEGIKLPSWFNDQEVLRSLYSEKLDVKKSIGHFKKHIPFLNDLKLHILTDQNIEYIKKGYIYTLGRDKQFRPIVILNVGSLKLSTVANLQIFVSGMVFYLDLVKRYCLVPGKVENWVIIIDTNNVGLLGLPFNLLNQVISVTQVNYMAALEGLYIMNPSFSLNTSWSIISAMIHKDTIEKIHFLKKSQFHKLLDHVDADNLEQKYGGTLPNLTEFWPPRNLSKEPPFQFSWEAYTPHKPRIFNGEFDPLPYGSNPPREQPILQVQAPIQDAKTQTHEINTQSNIHDPHQQTNAQIQFEEIKTINEAAVNNYDPNPSMQHNKMSSYQIKESLPQAQNDSKDVISTHNTPFANQKNEGQNYESQNLQQKETALQEKAIVESNSVERKEDHGYVEHHKVNNALENASLNNPETQNTHAQEKSENHNGFEGNYSQYISHQNQRSMKDDGRDGLNAEKKFENEWKVEGKEQTTLLAGDVVNQHKTNKKNQGYSSIEGGDTRELDSSRKVEVQLHVEGNEAAIRSGFCGFCRPSNQHADQKSEQKCTIF